MCTSQKHKLIQHFVEKKKKEEGSDGMEKSLCASASDGRKWYPTTFTATGNTTRVHGWAICPLFSIIPPPHIYAYRMLPCMVD